MTRQPERNETNAARQARLRERRKELGFRRISLWLSTCSGDSLETLGGEPWLGTTVKAFLESAVSERARQPTRQAALFANASNDSGPEPLPGNDKAALGRSGLTASSLPGCTGRPSTRRREKAGRNSAMTRHGAARARSGKHLSPGCTRNNPPPRKGLEETKMRTDERVVGGFRCFESRIIEFGGISVKSAGYCLKSSALVFLQISEYL